MLQEGQLCLRIILAFGIAIFRDEKKCGVLTPECVALGRVPVLSVVAH
jgi:hypothetical protein